MATDYPIEITDPDGSVRIAGLADFTDQDNQPQPAGPTAPFIPDHSGGDVVVVEKFGGATVLDYNDDDDRFNVNTTLKCNALVQAQVGFTAAGEIDLGASPTDTIGFFGKAAAVQQAAPVTLGDVIALLQVFGLAAS